MGMFNQLRIFSRWLATSVRRSHLDKDLERISSYMQGKVLEIGCGTEGRRGRFVLPWEQILSWFSVDIFPQRKPHVQADVQMLPFAANLFDTVVCLEVVEYVPEPSQAIAELFRVLSDGGILIFSVPFIHRQDCPLDMWRWTPAGCRELVQKAGFEVVELHCQAHALGITANIVKYGADVLSNRFLRMIVGMIVAPLSFSLWKLDHLSAKHVPQLADFTTGTLVVARKVRV